MFFFIKSFKPHKQLTSSKVCYHTHKQTHKNKDDHNKHPLHIIYRCLFIFQWMSPLKLVQGPNFPPKKGKYKDLITLFIKKRKGPNYIT